MASTKLVGLNGTPLEGEANEPLTANPAGIVAVGKMVVFHPRKATKATKGGIHLPDGSEEKFDTPLADVVAVGPETKQVKPGDVIMCLGEARIYPLFYEGEKLFGIEEDRILAVVGNARPR